MAKIFIIEDDVRIREELSKFLTSYGFDCKISCDFKNIVDIALDEKPDLILLDINLPYFDGYFVCREIRRVSSVPIIVVTSRDSDMDELMSMNLGADDFITKPYNTQVLLAHISAVLKRASTNIFNQTIIHKGVTLNIAQGTVLFKDTEIELTKNEFKILALLMRRQGTIVSRDDIMNELWQSDEFVDDNTLTVNINRLRKRLEELGITEFLMTKRGQGYMV